MIAILALFNGQWLRIAAVVAILATLIGAYVLIKQSGASQERAAIAQQEQRNDTSASRIRSGVDGLSDQSVDDRLRHYQRQ